LQHLLPLVLKSTFNFQNWKSIKTIEENLDMYYQGFSHEIFWGRHLKTIVWSKAKLKNTGLGQNRGEENLSFPSKLALGKKNLCIFFWK
jgi:hypothetical protein